MRTLQVNLPIFRFVPCAVWWEWRIWERTLCLPKWLEGARVWRSRRAMHWPNLLWSWHLHHGSLHLCARIQRRNMRGRSDLHFNLLFQAFLSLNYPRLYCVLPVETEVIFVNHKCSSCLLSMWSRELESGELISLLIISNINKRLYLWHLKSSNEKWDPPSLILTLSYNLRISILMILGVNSYAFIITECIRLYLTLKCRIIYTHLEPFCECFLWEWFVITVIIASYYLSLHISYWNLTSMPKEADLPLVSFKSVPLD